MHSKKGKMLKQPSDARGPSFGIPSPANGVVSKANAKDSTDEVVSDGMATQIEENPSHDHGSDGEHGWVEETCRPEEETRGEEAGNLHRTAEKDREAAKDFALRG